MMYLIVIYDQREAPVDLCKLETFTTVATFLNFRQAARTLNCTQSTVSARIRALEDEVGVPLFTRYKKQVALTAAGEKMQGYAHRLLAIGREALADVNGRREPAGRLSLRVPEAFAIACLPRLLTAFRQILPQVHLDVSSCSAYNLEHELQIGSVDLAVVFAETVPSANLQTECIMKAALSLVTHPSHPLVGKGPIDAGRLKGRTVYLPKTGCGYGASFRQLLAVDVSDPLAVHELTSVEAIKRCVRSGSGLTLLPTCCVSRELNRRALVELEWVRPLTIDVLMVWHADSRDFGALGAFQDIVRQKLAGTGADH